ncbi:MAG TPA: hypothetical protein VMD49_06755 [Steroidobacteraceae bacterium]|nr:hypothetical protein [Steroidobacteraceae bacterium]
MSAEPSAASLRSACEAPARVVGFSLFDGDLVNRLFGALGLGPWRPLHLLGRAAVLVALTWLPTAILSLWTTRPHPGAPRLSASFFTDFAAYAQFLIGLPLFVLAEAIVGPTTRQADQMFAQTGVVRRADLRRLAALRARIARLRDTPWADLAALALGGALSAAIIATELRHPQTTTWHTYVAHGWRRLSAPGYWEFLVALPLLNYWWLRQVWKVILWCIYLHGVSRLRLTLVATHPDRTGGIGFISQVQGHFAWLILAYGVSNVAATVGYELTVEHAQLWIPPVWGPIAGFAVGAPLLFLLPLFMFTRQLYRTKRRARRLYRQRVIEQVRLFERDVLPLSTVERTSMPAAIDLQLMTRFSDLFERCEEMRIVPFDFRSMGELFAAVIGTIASILPAQQLAKILPQAVGVVRGIVGFLAHGAH